MIWVRLEGLKMIFLSWRMDGIVVVSIKGKSYTYQVDAAMIPMWQRMAVRKPGKTLNEVKRFGKLVVEPREDSENTRCSQSINADHALQRKDNTMAKAMNWKDLRASYLSASYTVISKPSGAKNVEYPVLYRCPDCYAVYHKRAGKEPIPASYTKIMVFTKEGKPNVGACPCGYRKCGDKIQHSAQYLNEFGDTSTTTTSPADHTKDSQCCATTKAGKRCSNKATASGYCKLHAPVANMGF
mgnify:CR=1 FL=1